MSMEGAQEGRQCRSVVHSFVFQLHAHRCASMADEAHERTARHYLLLSSIGLGARAIVVVTECVPTAATTGLPDTPYLYYCCTSWMHIFYT